MAIFYIKQFDRNPALTSQLLDGVTPINLTGMTVKFVMSRASRRFEGAATVTDAAQGRVSYAWAAGDTDYVDRYKAEWIITDTATGKERTVPNSGYLEVEVVQRA